MQEFKMAAPTYNANLYSDEVADGRKPGFGPDVIPVVVRETDGIRVVLGTHNFDDLRKPDVQIKRHPNGWMIFLHPLGGSDACAYVFFVDDGRSFLVKETAFGPTPEIQIIEPNQDASEIFGLAPDHVDPVRVQQKCARCGQVIGCSGDWYLDRCPACADATEGDWACLRCGRSDTFEAMGGDGSVDPACCGSQCKHVERE